MLLAGRILRQIPRVRLALFRAPDRPLPRNVEGPWDWPPIDRIDRLDPGSPRALTISAEWGISAAPGRPEPYGRAGPWSLEASEVERAYGPDSVIHVSLEEFARTLTSRQETVERYREGGVSTRRIRATLRSRQGHEEVAEFHASYRKFRGFDRANLLTTFATFRPSLPFGREYPEAIQTGPLWPGVRAPAPRQPRGWLWYASPASSSVLVPGIDRGLSRLSAPPTVWVRSPRPLPLPPDRTRWSDVAPESALAWRERFRTAELRIVTGSRTLLEALELGGPFLYFNGVTGRGRARRRHRPEKIVRLLEAWRAEGIGRAVVRDLGAFASGQNVAAVAHRAASDPRFLRGFPTAWRPQGFRPPCEDGGQFLRHVVERWRAGAERAGELCRRLQAEGRHAIGLREARSEV